MRLSRKSALLVCALFIVCFIVFSIDSRLHSRLIRDAGYLLRPAWDKPNDITHEARPWIKIPQYYHPDIAVSDRCAAFGWTPRRKTQENFRVIDAIIFSIELDLLEIRLIELWPYVDVFLILEGTVTFTGLPKPMIFQEHRERFAWAKEKIIYRNITNLNAGDSEEARVGWTNEANTRRAVNALLHDTIHVADGDLVIESDVDEIPSASTISLLRSCVGYDEEPHLNLDTYMYSFEYSVSGVLPQYSTRAQIKTWHSGSEYAHHRTAIGKRLLLNSGWHCTFCFRNIADFQFKMVAFSHTDKLMYPKKMLNPRYIQDRLCSGKELFGMLPEAFSWKELWDALGAFPKVKTGELPKAVIQDIAKKQGKYSFLLPGNCQRKDTEEVQNDFDLFGPKVDFRGYG